MILQWLLNLAIGLVTGILSLLPSFSFDASAWTASAGDIGGTISQVNPYFPVEEIGVCLLALLAVELAARIWRVLVFVYELIPFKAS